MCYSDRNRHGAGPITGAGSPRGGVASTLDEFASGSSGMRAARRAVVFHYHLFKNAGTSVDELLRRNFGSRWGAREFNLNRRENATAVSEFICNNPQLQAISSHTALLPVSQPEGVDIFPVIFIRHPIDRLRSAYEFERRQNANTIGARLAKTHDFGGYLRELLRNPRHRQIRNFQTFRLSHNECTPKQSEIERAAAALQKLPFVGIVDRFEEAITELQIQLQPFFPAFHVQHVHRNISVSRQNNLSDRLAQVEAMLGSTLYKAICAANQDDLAIYELANSRLPRV